MSRRKLRGPNSMRPKKAATTKNTTKHEQASVRPERCLAHVERDPNTGKITKFSLGFPAAIVIVIVVGALAHWNFGYAATALLSVRGFFGR
jgi:hypothetical protein